MILSTTDFVDGKALFNPPKGARSGFESIYDKNSGYTDSGNYKFRVIATKKWKEYAYVSVSQQELEYLKELFYDSAGNPKEFLFKCDFMGKNEQFYATLDDDVSFALISQGKSYQDITFVVKETRRA